MNDSNNYGSNPYNANNNPQESPKNNENTVPTWTSQNPPNTQGYQQNSSYTWSTANQPPVYAAVKPKKAKKHTGFKIVAVLLACLLISVGSMGGFSYLIKQGYISIAANDTDNTAAFTINKVVRQEIPADNMSTEITQMTPQAIAEKLIPSVVCIQVFQKENQNQFNFNAYGNSSDSDSTLEPVSQGSGIIYNKDGYVITNAHVVSGDYNLKVITHDGEIYEAELIGADTETDLAVIKINGNGASFTPAEFGSSDDLKVADSVMAIGNPGGIALNSTVTMGYVSALNREVASAENAYALKYIQTDASINPGNSGGALVNMYGQVIGINTAKISQTGYEGLGFAIPIDSAQPIVSNLMEFGYVKDRAMIGITYTYVDEITARYNGLPATGLFVYGLTTDNAKSSGLAWGDLITSINGTDITSTSTVTSVLAQKKPGETISLGVTRPSTSEKLTIEVVLSENSGQTATTGE
ncbi:S1C family serine protease [Scatolibacter rhodanostii]|uniref:S1C family serine protease n=1 Tax=Scatolibacter rhodanostii TaxID=2014781 RepID=UPI000C07A921|nr:trypsin-like peptidase domain-containing protein [Scatolibacter rhodanostii]